MKVKLTQNGVEEFNMHQDKALRASTKQHTTVDTVMYASDACTWEVGMNNDLQLGFNNRIDCWALDPENVIKLKD